MGALTWGLNGQRKGTVYCSRCRAVFGDDLDPADARELIEETEKKHHCTPPKPWRVQRPQEQP